MVILLAAMNEILKDGALFPWKSSWIRQATVRLLQMAASLSALFALLTEDETQDEWGGGGSV